MKLICPSCQARLDIGAASRFDIFTCTCGRQFRGIYADFAHLDFLVKKFLLLRSYASGYDAPHCTPCPWCGSVITLKPHPKYVGFSPPQYCWACCQELPTSRINQFKQ